MSELQLWQWLLANLAIAAGAFLQGLVGYGIGTLAVPLVFLISPIFVPAPMMLSALLLNILMVYREHRGIQFAPVRHAIYGNIAGTVLAGFLLLVITPKPFEILFGFLILVAVGLSLQGHRPRLTPRNSAIAGGASGFMGTLTAIGGPPIALVYQNETGKLMRANLSAFFLFGSFIGMIVLTFIGKLGLRELVFFAASIPGILLGFWLSGHIVHKIDADQLRPLILGIAAVAGVIAIIRGVL